MKKVLFDSSFLIDCIRWKINFTEEIENHIGKFKPIITEQIKKELENKKLYELFKNMEVEKIDAKNADESIIKLVSKNKNIFVATNDKKLKSLLKKANIKVFYIRNLSKVCLE